MIRKTEGTLGPYKYIHVFVSGMGHRIDWINPPPKGTKVLSCFGDIETVDEIGAAGMVYHTGTDGIQNASFPGDLKMPS